MSNFIAIDLDAQGLYAVAGGARGSAKITHALVWTADGDDPLPALTAETAKAVGEKLRDRLKAANVPPAPVLVAVGRDRVILKELKYPPVPPTEEPALVRFQAMKEMSESPEEVVLDYAPLASAPGERRSMAVVLRKDQYNAIQAMCQAAGLKLAGVTPRPYATAAGLTRAFAAETTPAPADKGDAVGALTFGPAGGEFAVIRRGEVSFTLAIPAPVLASETMLVAQIRRNLAVYAGQYPAHPVQAIYVAEVGGDRAERLKTALGVPVHAYDPLAGAAPDIAEPLRGRFAGAAGLLAGRAADSLPINFASPRQPVVAKDPARRTLALVGLIALLLLLAGGAAGWAVVSKANAGVRNLTAKRDQLKNDLTAGTPDATRLKAIEAWQKREIVWLDELYDLADRMPQDDSVRVASLTATQLPPPKDGKDKGDGHAKLDLKLAATSNSAASNLMSAFVKDNTVPNKYFVGANLTLTGPIPGATRHKDGANLVARVNHREPPEYGREYRFTPLKRSGSGTTGGTPLPPAKVEPAPATTEKK
ncbi:MAG: hypothetical protein FJ304_07910 [Planctomycetes bacterium]|nr:hypothetical protein [Planctomycetota bacterium]